MKRIFLLCAASLSLALANVRAAEVTATLEPAQVAVGETAELTVTTTGSDNDAPAVPSVPGLDIAHVGQSMQVQIVNGSMTVSSVQTFEVTPQRGGTFTIPAIQAGGGRSRPLTLHVTGNSNGAAGPPVRRGTPPGSNAAPATLPPPGVQMPPTNAAAPAGSQYGFIQLVVPKKEFYVGEVVPVEVNAFLPAGLQATVNGLPTMGSEAFTLNPLGNKPEHGQREVGGRDYTVLTWHSAVTAVKAGDFPLSMKMPVTVVVREAPQRRQRDSDDPFEQLFNDPFFAGQFSALGKQKEVTLASEPEVLAVLPLPTANRPADFTGAVGRFEIKASATPVSVAAGDPITLRVAVSGAGAFDRASTDGLANSAAGWKTYPPKSTFEAADSVGYQGTKTFEQVVIPKDDGVKEIPALRFSFFDPETQRYEIRATTPIPVQVTGAPANFAATTTAVAAASPAAAGPRAEQSRNRPRRRHSAPGLPQPVVPRRAGSAARRIGHRAGVHPAQTPLRRRPAPRPRQRCHPRHSEPTRRHGPGDAPTCRPRVFLAARGALQQRLGERWGIRPETITLAEINARLNGAGEGIRPVFEMADQISYSGQAFGDADYRGWTQLVLTQLEQLEKHS